MEGRIKQALLRFSKKLFQTSVISQVKTQRVCAFIAENQLSHTNGKKTSPQIEIVVTLTSSSGEKETLRWVVEVENSRRFYSSHSLYVGNRTLIGIFGYNIDILTSILSQYCQNIF